MFFRSLFLREFSLIKKRPTFYLAALGSLSALSYVMMLVFHFPILPAYGFLKVDFADVGVAVAVVVLGPISAVIVAAAKCLLYLPIDIGETGGVGLLSNFICSFFFTATIAVVFHLRTLSRQTTPKRDAVFLIAAFVAGVIVETIAAMLSNWFIVIPLFIQVLGEGYRSVQNAAYIFAGVLPFNLIKFSMQAAAAYLLCHALVRILPKVIKDFAPPPERAVSNEPEASRPPENPHAPDGSRN
ncbi:MAG: ECF transporter S component [Clostridiales bacterium]|jgi:riboflavin transporter FmnP|nr:ECF transporter S component [Clostridiales bacterium]